MKIRNNRKFKLAKILLGAMMMPIMSYNLWAQVPDSKNVGIGTNDPDASALLDLNVNDDVMFPDKLGLLIPRVALQNTNDTQTITNPANSLLIYNTATTGVGGDAVTPGFYYWNGTQWEKLSTSTEINSYLPIAGGTMTGAINGITNLSTGSLNASGDITFSGLTPDKIVKTTTGGLLTTGDITDTGDRLAFFNSTGILSTESNLKYLNGRIGIGLGASVDPTQLLHINGGNVYLTREDETTNAELRFGAINGSAIGSYIGLKAIYVDPDGQTTNNSHNTYILPTARGTQGQVLSIQTVGDESQLNWATIPTIPAGTAEGQTLRFDNTNGIWVADNSILINVPTGTGADTNTVVISGDTKILGDLHITNDLRVDGTIDPIAIIMQPQNSAPGAIEGKFYYDGVNKKIKINTGTEEVSGTTTPVWEFVTTSKASIALPENQGTDGQVLKSNGDGTTAWSTDGSDDRSVPTGAIMPFAGTTAPAGWAFCDGAAVSRTENSDLFNVIGESYGSGDGSTTFNLPNLQQKFPLGASNVTSVGSVGGEATVTLTEAQMPSHSHRVKLFSVDGNMWPATDETYPRTPEDIDYSLYTGEGVGTLQVPGFSDGVNHSWGARRAVLANENNNIWLSAHSKSINTNITPSLPLRYAPGTLETPAIGWTKFLYLKKDNVIEATGGATAGEGADVATQPHNNMPPYVTMNYIIKL